MLNYAVTIHSTMPFSNIFCVTIYSILSTMLLIIEFIVSIVLLIVYVVEISIRILAVGPLEYFRKWWNR